MSSGDYFFRNSTSHCSLTSIDSQGTIEPVRHTHNLRRALGCLALAITLLFSAREASAYSLLSHEEVVDMAWPRYLVPLLQKRYPGLTPAQLTECHAYAYGGSVIQDMGYYPFGSKEFSDMLHYVRTDGFVAALLRDARTPQEYAFALGAMAHFYGDTVGHPTVNIITGEEYPRLRRRFGRIVTYDEDATAHLRNEFGFDVVEVAHGAYSQQNYRDFIGFKVAEPLLNQAFEDTYGMPISDLLGHEGLSIESYRYSVSRLIPEMTKIALAGYGDQIQRADPSRAKTEFLYRLKRTDYEREYGKHYQRPTIGARIFALFLDLIPKVGPFSGLKLHLPNGEEQTQYLANINAVENAYRSEIEAIAATRSGNVPPSLPELDFDTGAPTAEGEYKLADLTYAKWVERLARESNAHITPGVAADINHFYANPQAKDALKKHPRKWAKFEAALSEVRKKPIEDRAPAPATSTPPR